MAGPDRIRAVWPRLWWVAAVIFGIGVLVVAAKIGGAATSVDIPGLPTAGESTTWGLLLARFVAEVAGALCAGTAITAGFLLPGEGDRVGTGAFWLLRWVAWTAVAWAIATAALFIFTLSDLLGQPPGELSGKIITSFATSIPQGQALTMQAGSALIVALLAQSVLTRAGAAVLAVVATLNLLPPVFTGHAAGSGNHQLAVSSLAVHVLAAALWIGGLFALVVLRPRAEVPGAATRYSRLALACWVAVAFSGGANAAVRLGSLSALFGSAYGLLILGKLLALLLLGGLGAVHRQRTLDKLSAGAPGAFGRLAAGELVVFAATVGLAVALSRSPTPVSTSPRPFDRFTDLLGFAMPPPLTGARLITQALPDLIFILIVIVGIGAYLAGVMRLRQAGHRWPPSRTASWLVGMLLLGAITNLGLARYAYVLFSLHMVEHMMLSMAVPILLVGGAPLTLALRALRNPTDPAMRGPRQWLQIALRSKITHFFTNPLVALALYAAGLYALYFSELFTTLMRFHLGHLAMTVHFLASGYLLFWVLIGIDPGRRRVAPPLLILVLFAAMVFHAFFGMALMLSQRPVAGAWFLTVHPQWAQPIMGDQGLGAGIAWAFGEIPAAIVMGLLVFQWIRADEREQRRVDRAAERAEADGVDDDLARYNEFLRQASAAPATARAGSATGAAGSATAKAGLAAAEAGLATAAADTAEAGTSDVSAASRNQNDRTDDQ